MAKAILAGEEVKKNSFQNCFTQSAAIAKIISGFPEYFFMGNSPCNTGNRAYKNKR